MLSSFNRRRRARRVVRRERRYMIGNMELHAGVLLPLLIILAAVTTAFVAHYLPTYSRLICAGITPPDTCTAVPFVFGLGETSFGNFRLAHLWSVLMLGLMVGLPLMQRGSYVAPVAMLGAIALLVLLPSLNYWLKAMLVMSAAGLIVAAPPRVGVMAGGASAVAVLLWPVLVQQAYHQTTYVGVAGLLVNVTLWLAIPIGLAVALTLRRLWQWDV